MTLKEYIKKQGITQNAFAETIGVSRVSLNRIIQGSDPRPGTARRIVEVTKQAVTFNDLYGL